MPATALPRRPTTRARTASRTAARSSRRRRSAPTARSRLTDSTLPPSSAVELHRQARHAANERVAPRHRLARELPVREARQDARPDSGGDRGREQPAGAAVLAVAEAEVVERERSRDVVLVRALEDALVTVRARIR